MNTNTLNLKVYLTFLASLCFISTYCLACDVCGIYTPLLIRQKEAGQINFGVRQDFFGYSKTHQDGKKIDSRGNHKIFVTELTAQYALSQRLSFLTALPLVSSRFRRDIDAQSFSGSDNGVGEVSIYADLVIAKTSLKDGGFFQWDLFAGTKLPTASSSRLNELKDIELSESGLYAGALSLGSGSFDFPIATGFRRQSQNWVTDAMIQYNIRTEGDKDYRYGDDLRWEFATGKRFGEEKDFSFAAQLALSGISNQEHQLKGTNLDNTKRSFIAIGPRVEANWGDKYQLISRIEIPVNYDNDGVQTLRGHRVTIGFYFRI